MQRQYYLWTAGATTLTVALADGVIARLRDAMAAENTNEEIGGFLLGRRESDDCIAIEDFELLASEHRRGLTFTLSGADKRRLTQRLRASHRGLEPLGSFRSHLRQGLYMDQYDFDLMSQHFPALNDVMLLIRPNDWQAGFFTWEEGDMYRQKSYLEFPFDPAALPFVTHESADRQPEVAEPRAADRRQSPAENPPQQPARTGTLPFLPPLSSMHRLPTLMNVGIISATAGLAAVLAFYTHELRAPKPVLTEPVVALAPNINKPSPWTPTDAVNPPVDPDGAQSGSSYELHVKIPSTSVSPRSSSRTYAQSPLASNSQQKSPVPPQPAAPPTMPQPMQTASTTPPPLVARAVLRPIRPPFVTEVSLEPSQPGILRRGINHVPVLSLFQRHSFRSGNSFSPAQPVREVKPRLPEDLQSTGPQHPDVDVKVWIDKEGQVTKAEALTDDVEPEIAKLASNAAIKWTFVPAHLSDKPVSSEMVMHFRFVAKQNY